MRTFSYLSVPCPCMRSEQHRVGERIVVGEAAAAIAVTAERFRRKETGAGSVADGARALAVERGAEGLRGVAQHQQILRFSAIGSRRAVIGGLAEQIDRHHRART